MKYWYNMHVHHAGEKYICHAEWSLALPFASDPLFDLLTLVLASHISVGSNAMDNMGVSSSEKISGVDSGEGVVLSSSRWMGSICEEDADGVGPTVEDVLHVQYGNINKYQNYETCNGTYGIPELFMFMVEHTTRTCGSNGTMNLISRLHAAIRSADLGDSCTKGCRGGGSLLVDENVIIEPHKS